VGGNRGKEGKRGDRCEVSRDSATDGLVPQEGWKREVESVRKEIKIAEGEAECQKKKTQARQVSRLKTLKEKQDPERSPD